MIGDGVAHLTRSDEELGLCIQELERLKWRDPLFLDPRANRPLIRAAKQAGNLIGEEHQLPTTVVNSRLQIPAESSTNSSCLVHDQFAGLSVASSGEATDEMVGSGSPCSARVAPDIDKCSAST
jgi:hypothetical protein